MNERGQSSARDAELLGALRAHGAEIAARFDLAG
jgi:hypothetical protein